MTMISRGDSSSSLSSTSFSTGRLSSLFLLLSLSSLTTIIVRAAVVHDGFIDEVVSSTKAMSGTFAPNPRNNNIPMMILNAKNGQISVLENPDESPDSIEILDLSDGSDDKLLCTNGERGLHSVIPSPNFAENQYLYAFYTKYREDCLEDAFEGPWNVVTRFTMNPETLMLDFDGRTVIWRGTKKINQMNERINLVLFSRWLSKKERCLTIVSIKIPLPLFLLYSGQRSAYG